MGPLSTIFGQLLDESLKRRFPDVPAPIQRFGLTEDRPLSDPPGLGPRPFRDPMQEGPAVPPGRGPLSMMFRGPNG